MFDCEVEARRVRALDSLPRLVAALRARGARRVWLVGSLQWGVHERSDIDLAVEGLANTNVATAHAELLDLAPGRAHPFARASAKRLGRQSACRSAPALALRGEVQAGGIATPRFERSYRLRFATFSLDDFRALLPR